MSNNHQRNSILRRIVRFFLGRDEPSPELSSPTLFTATRLPGTSVTTEPEPLFDAAPAATRERDLWDDEPLVRPSEADEPLFAAREADPPATESPAAGTPDLEVPEDTGDEDVSVEALTQELSRLAQDDPYDPAASTPDEPDTENLFSSPQRRQQRLEVSPRVPQHATEGDDGPRVSVHGERLDTRPGPIRMTPSEALALAKDGREALRRRRPSG